MLKIFQCLCLNCLLCRLALATLSNGLCIGSTYMNCSIQEYWTWPCLSWQWEWRLQVCAAICVLLHTEPFQFFTLQWVRPPSFSPNTAAHGLSLLKSPSPTVRDKKNQYNTKQWLISLRVQCAERSPLYIMYNVQLMVSVCAAEWMVSTVRRDDCTYTTYHTYNY